jgi:hypothetical protein
MNCIIIEADKISIDEGVGDAPEREWALGSSRRARGQMSDCAGEDATSE